MAVTAERVVGDDDLGADLPDHGHQLAGRLEQVGSPEAVGVVVGRRAHHPGVPPAARTSEEPDVGHPEFPHRRGQLALAVRAQLVLRLRGEVGQVRQQDLTLLAPGAGDQRDGRPLGGVPGHGHPGPDRLVVGMGVDEKQAAVAHGHHCPAGCPPCQRSPNTCPSRGSTRAPCVSPSGCRRRCTWPRTANGWCSCARRPARTERGRCGCWTSTPGTSGWSPIRPCCSGPTTSGCRPRSAPAASGCARGARGSRPTPWTGTPGWPRSPCRRGCSSPT